MRKETPKKEETRSCSRVKSESDPHYAPSEGLEEPNKVWASIQTAAKGRDRNTPRGGRCGDTHAQITLRETLPTRTKNESHFLMRFVSTAAISLSRNTNSVNRQVI